MKQRLVFSLFIFLAVIFLKNIKRTCSVCHLPGKRSLLLIAHPDDESMFFAPTVLSLGRRVVLLCLSEGNYYGKGRVRRMEMKNLCKSLKVRHIVFNLDDNGDWDPVLICKLLKLVYHAYNFERIYTFDKDGVSGHKNHVSCFEGAKLFTSLTGIPSMYLRSKGIISKYLFDLEVSGLVVRTCLRNVLKPTRMMLKHRSQLTWYRMVYVFISNYMYYNDYINITS